MLDRFHSKFHRYNHHTTPTSGFPDSALDPIAAPSDPFQGPFCVLGTVSATNVTSLSNIDIGEGVLDIGLLTDDREFVFPDASGIILLDTTADQAISASLVPILSAALIVPLSSTLVPIITSTVVPVITATMTPIISAAVEADVEALVTSLFNNLNVNRTVWVNPLSGNDSTGQRNRIDQPFKSLAGAQLSALSGDTVVVENGNYAEYGLGKNGVDWLFGPSTTFTITGFLSAPLFIFNDINYNVYGHASILLSGSNVDPIFGNVLIASFSNAQAGDDIIFEFKDINIVTPASLIEAPITSLFSGVSSDANILINALAINAPKFNCFGGFTGANTPRILRINLDQNLIVQNLFTNSITNLSCHLYSPLISATDYLFQDSLAITNIGGIWFDTNSLYGSIVKQTATGNIYINASNYTIIPRTSAIIWDTTADGFVNLNIEGNFNSNLGMSTAGNTYINASNFIFVDSFFGGFGFKTRGALSLETSDATMTYFSSGFNMFQMDLSASELAVEINRLTNNTALSTIVTSNILTTTGVIDGAIIDLDIEHLFGGGNISLSSIDIKARLYIGDTNNTTTTIFISPSSVGTLISLGGGWRAQNINNVVVTALSGQSNSKLYIDAGTIFEAVSAVNTFDLTQVIGNPLSIFVRGTALANTSATFAGSNYTIKGSFITDSSIIVPVF